MKLKYIFFAAILIISTSSLFSQCHGSKYSYWEASSGIGLLPTFLKDNSKTELIPLFFILDKRINRNFSLGFYAGHTRVKGDFELLIDNEISTLMNKFTMIGLRYAVHSNYSDIWDHYGGMNLGYTILDIEILEGNVESLKLHHNYKAISGKMLFSAFIGTKYTPKNKSYSIFGEIGYGISILSLGFSQKL